MSKASRLFVYLCLPCLALCLALGTQGKNAREFAGTYKIVKATEQGDMMEVKVSLRVVNYSEADVKGATISLRSSLTKPSATSTMPWEKEATPFKDVALNLNEHKRVAPLEGTFTVPTEEYKRWQKGFGPNFVIDFEDASGKTRHEQIELARMP
jgi:hypothetical protein